MCLCGEVETFLVHLGHSGDSAILHCVTQSQWDAEGARAITEPCDFMLSQHGGSAHIVLPLTQMQKGPSHLGAALVSTQALPDPSTLLYLHTDHTLVSGARPAEADETQCPEGGSRAVPPAHCHQDSGAAGLPASPSDEASAQ